jgi:integrase
MNPMDPITTRQLNRAIHAAAETAKIDKRVSMHTLRHYPESRNMPSDLIIHLSHGRVDQFHAA